MLECTENRFRLRNEEDRIAIEEVGSHVDKCPSIIGKVAPPLVEILLKEGSAIKKRS